MNSFDNKKISSFSCPLCGESNQCNGAKRPEERESICWCEIEHFPKSLFSHLESLGIDDATCVCSRCIEKFS